MHDWHYFFQQSPAQLEQGVYRIFEPERKAELLLWFKSSAVEKQQKEALINTLIQFDDRCGNFFRYRAYFLAAEIIADFKDCAMADQIVDQVLRWSYAYCRTEKQNWKIYPHFLTQAARATLKRTDQQRVVDRLTAVVHTIDSVGALRHAAVELGRISPGNPHAIAALEHLIKHPQSLRNQLKAVQSLIQIDPNHKSLVPTLIEIARSALERAEPDEWSIRDVVWQLKRLSIAIGNESAINLLSELALTGCHDIAEALGVIGQDSDIAVSILVELVRRTCLYPAREFDPFVQISGWDAVEALGKIAVGHATAIAQLSHLLSEAKDMPLRCHAAAALLRIDANNTQAMTVLRDLLAMAQSELALYLATEPTRYDCDEIKLARSIVWRTADSLGRNDPTYQPAIEALVTLAHSSRFHEQPFLCAIESLNHLDPSQHLTAITLVKWVEANPDSFVYDVFACFLKATSPQTFVITALTDILQTSQSNFTRKAAADTLSRIDAGNALAMKTLLELLEAQLLEAPDTYQNWTIVCQLAEMYSHDEQVICALMQFIQRLDDSGTRVDRQRLADCFQTLRVSPRLIQVVQTLKQCLSPHRLGLDNQQSLPCAQPLASSTDSNAETSSLSGSCDRHDMCEQIIWYCAQTMNYADFYKAWNTPGR
jgi:HEAT repeat protein